jgi:thioredoxin reductase (NADPH)
MSQYLVDRITSADNITVLGHSEITAVHGNGHLERIDVRNVVTGEVQSHDGHALFIFIGVSTRTEAFAPLVATDEKGFILTGADARASARSWGLDRDPLMFETSVPGIFAAGDVRLNANRRIAAAVGEGSAAIFSIHQYLRTV